MENEKTTPYYLLEIDNSIFSSEEELIAHIRDNHTKEVPSDIVTRINSIEKELKFAFPEWKVQMKKASQSNTFAVTLKRDSLKFTLMYNKNTTNEIHGTYKSISELSHAFQEKQSIVNSILTSAANINSLKCFSFTSYYAGYTQDEEVFEFSFLNSKINLANIYFYPAEQTIESFCALIERFDTSILEGDVVNLYNRFGQVEDITVEGFSLKYLEMLGKKVKIEIKD